MSLVAWWPLNGSHEPKVGELNSYEQGNVQYGSGKIGDCYDNTGDNGTGIELVRHDEFVPYEAHYSFSLWFKSTTTSGSGGERLISRDASEYPTVIVRQNESSPQNFRFYEATETDTTTVSVNEWHHLAFTIDVEQNNSQIFIDGELVGTGGYSNSTNARPYVIGGNTEGDGDISGNHFAGKIDDVRLYDHILSQKEVQQLSQAKVLHYKFNEDESIEDATGRGYNGEIIRSPTSTTDSAIGSQAINFGSGDNAVTVSNAPDFSNPNKLTLSVWAKSNQSSWKESGSILTRRDQFTVHPSSNSQHTELYVHTTQNNWENVTVYPDDIQTWNHYALTYENGTLTGYLNGEKKSTTSVGANLESDTGLITIGRDDDGDTSYGNEKIDDPRIYTEALTDAEIKELYKQRASIDSGGNFHSHEAKEGAQESFETGSFGPKWNVSNATISSDRSYFGNYSFGSWGDGGVEATYTPFDGERQIDSFEYYWKEDSSQTGHVVILLDSNGNEIMESGTENPQWYLNDGSGGRFQEYGGDNYNEWTKFRFDFDWENGTYDYHLEDLSSGTVRTGTTSLDNSTGVSEIRFTGSGYGSANYNRFDGIKVEDNSISQGGVARSAQFNEIGPAPESLVGWWPLDGNARDHAGTNDGTVNGASVTSGLGQSAYDFDGADGAGNNDNIATNLSNDTSSSKTLCGWFSTNNDGQIVGGNPPQYGGVSLYISNGNLILNSNNGNNSGRVSSSLGSEDWFFGVGTANITSNTLKLYINGSLSGTENGWNGNYNNDQDFTIGTDDLSGPEWNYTGKIQDVRIYDRAITESEVQTLYNLTDPRTKQQVIQNQDGTINTKNEFNELL